MIPDMPPTQSPERPDTLPFVADVKDVQKESRVDELMTRMAYGRVALGAAAFLAPALTVKLMGLGTGNELVTRIFASREIALGAGYLLSKDAGRQTWARLGVVVDSLDTVAGIKSRKAGVPLWAAAGFSAVAAGAASIGAAKVASRR
ncbi:MAG: hypothetical protein JWN00_5366 [Actinomycetia bacterium]|nr:hypothetical protein [Actinomycetes bacterium]